MNAIMFDIYKQEVLDFFHDKFLKINALICALAAAFVIVSFVTYSSADPSFNNATDNKPVNLMGYSGSYFADIIYQFFGFCGAPAISLIFMMWGYKFYTGRYISKLWLRAIFMLIAAASISALFSSVLGMGGVIGGFLKNKLYLELTAPIFNSLFVILFLVAGHFASGLKPRENREFFRIILTPFRKVFSYFRRGELELYHRVFSNHKRKEREIFEVSPDVRNVKTDPSMSDYIKKIHSPRAEAEKKRPAAKQASLMLGTIDDNFEMPPIELLKEAPARIQSARMSETALSQNAKILEKVLEDFGVKGEITRISPGPVVTLYELEPSAGTKSSRVIALAEDIARSMSAVSARIAVVPGQNAIGIELPNSKRETVYFREMIESDYFAKAEEKLPLALGKDIGGAPIVMDLAKMPHLLVAGTTGSGKSVAINTMILSLLYKMPPSKCKFIMIDPKMLELSVYEGIPHLLTPVVTDPYKAVVALKWVVGEMENRYRLMATLGVKNIDGFNTRIEEAIAKGEVLERKVQTGFDPENGRPIMEQIPIEMQRLPYIVVIVDEMADLMLVAGKDIEGSIQRIAQMARAAGIHLIVATQRPSVDVITGVIKANLPTRISFQVTSKIDSRTILGEQGAEQLLGQGDMLYMAGGSRITRIHGPFADEREVEKVVSFLKEQGEPEYIHEVTIDQSAEDEGFEESALDSDAMDDASLYDRAVAIVVRDKKASTSYIQRRLRIGYNRAATLIEQMEQEGVISSPNHAGKREILVPTDNG